jgi:hypothetical protein
MKTPPLLLGACLLFWGWQSDLLPAAAIMAVILECSRFIKDRWETDDADVSRIWNFCSLLGLAAAIFAFTSKGGAGDFGKLLEKPNFSTGQSAITSSTAAAIGLLRWLPMIFYLFVAAQVYGSRAEIPLETISPFLRYRRKRLLKSRRPAPPVYYFNPGWPYFVMCLFAASAHAATDNSFFWGLCGLVGWALWSERPAGSVRHLWVVLLVGVVASGFFGQEGLGALARLADLADDYNPSWLARFMPQRTDPEQSHTSIGHIGRLKMSSAIVLRVAPVNGAEVPTYLREASYRRYREPEWSVVGLADDFSSIHESPADSDHWDLQPGQTNRAVVNISCYLNGVNIKDGFSQGVLPLPVDADYLDQLPAYVLENNPVGTVLAEGPGMLIFNAAYGSGTTMDAPPGTNDLEVPLAERRALAQVAAELRGPRATEAQKIAAVSQFFAANFQYSLWQGDPHSRTNDETALGRFLLQTRSGHCEYFATATVLLLREMHIPARYAVGYYVHEASGKHYVVRDHDAHAWCLVWDFTAKTWQTLDTTPASWVEVESKRTSSWQSLADLFSWFGYQFAKFRYGQGNLRPYLLLTLVPALGWFLWQILFRRRRHKPHAAAAVPLRTDWPGLDSEFYLLEQKLARRGLVRRPAESLADWLGHVAVDPAVAEHRDQIRQLLQLHYRHRFDPLGLAPAERAELSRQAKACVAAIT